MNLIIKGNKTKLKALNRELSLKLRRLGLESKLGEGEDNSKFIAEIEDLNKSLVDFEKSKEDLIVKDQEIETLNNTLSDFESSKVKEIEDLKTKSNEDNEQLSDLLLEKDSEIKELKDKLEKALTPKKKK